MPLKIGLLGFGRTGSLVAKEILSDSDLSLEWVCRKSSVNNLVYASPTLGLKETSGPCGHHHIYVFFKRTSPNLGTSG